MNPTAPKSEEGIADAIDKWKEQIRVVEAMGDQYKLPDVYKIAALKTLMAVGKAKEYFKTIESNRNFDQLLKLCREYGTKRKLEGDLRLNQESIMDLEKTCKG